MHARRPTAQRLGQQIRRAAAPPHRGSATASANASCSSWARATQGSPSNSSLSLLRGVSRCSSAPGRCRIADPQRPDLGVRAQRAHSQRSTVARSHSTSTMVEVSWTRHELSPGELAHRSRRRDLRAAFLRARRPDRQPPHLGQPAPLRARDPAPGGVHPDVAARWASRSRDPRGAGHAARPTASRPARTGRACRPAGAPTSTSASCTCSACATTSPTASAAAA